MIIALAGRRIDAAGTETVRFPLEMKDAVRQRILKFFAAEKVTALVSSAACGADLLAQDAARELKIEQHIILPFSRRRFRKTSVTDRPGEWGKLFDEICSEVERDGNLIVLRKHKVEKTAYSAVTDKILELAEDLQRKNETVKAVIVWEGKAKDEADETAAFAEKARLRNIVVKEILTK